MILSTWLLSLGRPTGNIKTADVYVQTDMIALSDTPRTVEEINFSMVATEPIKDEDVNLFSVYRKRRNLLQKETSAFIETIMRKYLSAKMNSHKKAF